VLATGLGKGRKRCYCQQGYQNKLLHN
jgi:hypothetical protein